MNKIKKHIIISLLFLFNQTFSQSSFLPARPSQSMGGRSVGSKNLLFETGGVFQKNNINQSNLLRYGWGKTFETNLAVANIFSSKNKVNFLQLGIRKEFIHNKIIDVAYELRIKQHFFDNDVRKNYNSLGLLTAHLIRLSKSFDLTINYGFERQLSHDGSKHINYTLKPTYYNKNAQFFIESFGDFYNSTFGLDIGTAIQLKSKYQIDIALGTMDFNNNKSKFFELGFSIKLND